MSYGNYAPFYRPGYFNPIQNMQVPVQNMPDTQFNSQYQPPMQGAPYQMPAQNVQTSDMLWVLNENEATSYPVAPNNTVTLWDKNLPTIYIKSVDANGVPSMRILDFSERATNTPKIRTEHKCNCGDKFVTLETFNALQVKFDELTAKFKELSTGTIAKSKETVDNG